MRKATELVFGDLLGEVSNGGLDAVANLNDWPDDAYAEFVFRTACKYPDWLEMPIVALDPLLRLVLPKSASK